MTSDARDGWTLVFMILVAAAAIGFTVEFIP
jgi:hypothetical protein